MNHIFKSILITIGLFMHGHWTYAQTLNADTLVKYHITKIITYKLDSAGQKTITKIRSFNDKGLPIESYSYDKFFIESELRSVFIDSVKAVYNKNSKIANHTNNRTVITYSEGAEKTNHYSYQTTYHYKRPFIISPFQKETHLYTYTKNGDETIKRYLKGRREGYFIYSNKDGYKYSFEKFYRRKKKKRIAFFRKKFKSDLGQKHLRQIKALLNSNGDVSQENISATFYSRKLFIKPLEYSYIKTYTYVYKNSFIAACTTVQPNYTRTSKAKKETAANKYKRSKKRIYFIEERGTIEKTEIYEYITNPE